MNKRLALLNGLVCGIVGLLVLALHLVPTFEARAVAVHQRSVMRSLANWEEDDSRVCTWEQADHAIDMLEYVRAYYVPGPGYRSDAQTEAALEEQRARTLAAIAAALRSFTGEDLGTDPERWRTWRERNGPRRPQRHRGTP
jgi:hypothetical protein